MSRYTVIAVLSAALCGFGAGVVVMGLSTGGRSVSASPTSSPTPVLSAHNVPVDCRSALHLASEGFGVAIEGLGQAQAAASTPVPPGATSPTQAVLGTTSGRVQALLHDYNLAQATCQSITTTQAAPTTQANATPLSPAGSVQQH